MKGKSGIVLIFLCWIVIAWLIYPLFVWDRIEMTSAKEYVYRSAIAIALMIILFGKTVFDLLFPQFTSRKTSVFNTVFLTVYSMVIAIGIILMVSRVITLTVRNRESNILF